jgi:hypothetical protein
MLSLDYVRTYRGMPWIKRGMVVIVAGKEGHVAGGHGGGNIAVKFPERRRTANCHPQWETVYYDKAGQIVADYREAQGDLSGAL